MPTKIAVVGAGAPGLSSALRILQQFPSADVTVIADNFENETTSSGAAGFISPIIHKFMENSVDNIRKWVNDGFSWFTQLAAGGESVASGVIFTSGYILNGEKAEQDIVEMTPFVQNFRILTADQLVHHSTAFKSGIFCTTVMVECEYYLPWLMNRIKELGGRIIRKRISDFVELAGSYDIVVNCAGLANRHLVNDQTIHAMRGQVLRMKAPWIKHFIFDVSRNYHIFAGRDHAVVGGTRQPNNYNTQVDARDTQTILKEAEKLVPSIKYATIDREWVGLRPVRPTVRLERQVITVKDKTLVLIHNYGHGSKGINLSWGTAGDVVKLVGETLQHSKL